MRGKRLAKQRRRLSSLVWLTFAGQLRRRHPSPARPTQGATAGGLLEVPTGDAAAGDDLTGGVAAVSCSGLLDTTVRTGLSQGAARWSLVIDGIRLGGASPRWKQRPPRWSDQWHGARRPSTVVSNLAARDGHAQGLRVSLAALQAEDAGRQRRRSPPPRSRLGPSQQPHHPRMRWHLEPRRPQPNNRPVLANPRRSAAAAPPQPGKTHPGCHGRRPP